MMHLIETWQQLVCDLYEHGQKHSLLILDYCSRFVKVTQLRNTLYSTAMSQATGIFTWHSMYCKLICKSSLQYIPKVFQKFAKDSISYTQQAVCITCSATECLKTHIWITEQTLFKANKMGLKSVLLFSTITKPICEVFVSTDAKVQELPCLKEGATPTGANYWIKQSVVDKK